MEIDGMDTTQSDHTQLDLLSLVIWLKLRKGQIWSKSVFIFDRSHPHSLTLVIMSCSLLAKSLFMILSDLVDKIMEKMSSDSKNRRQVLMFLRWISIKFLEPAHVFLFLPTFFPKWKLS